MKKWVFKSLWLIVFFLLASVWKSTSNNSLNEVKVQKIWDFADHNAFTDLIIFKGNYYCSFREGSGHIPGTDGKVRILKSSDGDSWESIALLEKEGIDLRDPKLSITPKGLIMVTIGGSIYKEGKLLGRKPHVSFSDKSGKSFSDPAEMIIEPDLLSWGDWIWRVTWHKKIGYAIDYQIGPEERRGPTALFLVKTTDGINFSKVSKLEIDGFPNESTLRFDKEGNMFVMVRRELEDKMGVLAYASPPYTEWKFNKMDYRLGGPNFIFTNNEQIVAGTRIYEKEVHTGILVGDKSGSFRKTIKLPSAGDNSYPGLILEEKRLLVSYYSTHEGKSSIYIAKIPLDLLFRQSEPKDLNSVRIWEGATHNAFTDLIRYKDRFFCTFREANGHVPKFDGDDGTIRILESKDGDNWSSAALIQENGIDLRDPKLSLMPDGRLMLVCGGSDYVDGSLMEWHTRVAFSNNGKDWSRTFRVRGIPSNNWFFRITWKDNIGYVAANICKADPVTGKVIMGYTEGTARQLVIYKTEDGMNYEQVSNDIAPTPVACEATIKFKEDSTMLIVIRNAGTSDITRYGMLAFSVPPYRDVSYISKIDHILGGPNIIHTKSGKWLIGTRGKKERIQKYDPESNTGSNDLSTVLLLVDEDGYYDLKYELPSGGDTGYPGFVIYDKKLWISYYSSHEGRSSIYLTTLPINDLN